MEEEAGLKPWVSAASALVGISLIGASFFVVGEDAAHKLLYDITQTIMLVSGCIAVITGVVGFFIRTSDDIWS
ncbi:MAG: hypothetical protein K8F91_22940 [Candidatus Obscuribacterales bacterium]|nr:hypothetical protein [Candidatus Obscuribacterales bacterium]